MLCLDALPRVVCQFGRNISYLIIVCYVCGVFGLLSLYMEGYLIPDTILRAHLIIFLVSVEFDLA